MLTTHTCAIADVYVPAKRVQSLDPEKVVTLAEDILLNGQTTPIRLRKDGNRYVLLEGLHRLEALRALGETMVEAYLTSARLH